MQRKVRYPVLALIALIALLLVHVPGSHHGFEIFSILWLIGALIVAWMADTSNIRQGNTKYVNYFDNTRGIRFDGIATGEVLEIPGP